MCSTTTNQQFSLHEALAQAQCSLTLSAASSSWPTTTMDQQGTSQMIHHQQVSSSPIKPRPLDILCGKSKKCVDHGGSRRFRSVIECYKEKYQQALTKWDKTSVTRTIYDHLSQAGSRFLKYNESMKIWEEISPIAARDKIGHALRFANRVTRRKRGPKCIGGGQQEADLPLSADEPIQKPRSLLVLGGTMPSSTSSLVAATTSPPPPPPPPVSQPLHIQAPFLSSAAVEDPTNIKPPQNLSQLLELLPCTQTQQPQTNVPNVVTTTTTPTTTFLGGLVQLPSQPLQAPAGMLTQSFAPLDRSQQWYQTTHTTVEDAKINKPSSSKPVLITIPPTGTVTGGVACPISLDDSFSFLDEIFPSDDDDDVTPPQAVVQEQSQVVPAIATTTHSTSTISSCSSSASNDDLCLGDLDFDAEILSVLL